jgi:hypothetical protein
MTLQYRCYFHTFPTEIILRINLCAPAVDLPLQITDLFLSVMGVVYYVEARYNSSLYRLDANFEL